MSCCAPDIVPGGHGTPGLLLCRPGLVPSSQAHCAAFSDSTGTRTRQNLQVLPHIRGSTNILPSMNMLMSLLGENVRY
jgi:hypothetical protein